MKWFIAILVLAIVLIAGCTSNASNASNQNTSTSTTNKFVGTWLWTYDNFSYYFIFYDNKTLLEQWKYPNGTVDFERNFEYEIANQSAFKLTYINGTTNVSFYMNYRFLGDDTLEIKALGISGWNYTRQK